MEYQSIGHKMLSHGGAIEERSKDHQVLTIHHEENIKICTKDHPIVVKNVLKNHKIQLLCGSRGKFRRSSKIV